MIPRADGDPQGDSCPVTAEILQRIGFTDHALERFSGRAKLGVSDPRAVERLVRDLLLREGRIVTRRPSWSRSRNRADLYLQVGEWMLFVAVRDRRRAGAYAVLTAVNGSRENSWKVAHRRGYVATPPPLVAGRSARLARLLTRAVLATLRRARRGSASPRP